jgi:transposase
LGRSRGGYGSKFHLVTDGNGTPLAVEVTAGQVYESTQMQAVMERVSIPQPLGRPRRRPKKLAGDKAYRARHVRDWLWKYGIKPVIPRKANERKRGRPPAFDKQSYRRRALIENCVGWLKECRRIATRFEKLAVSYLGMLKLAMIDRYLRLL